ncbi:MAG: hypothetical protein JNJ44_12365 [Zoogloeaceae bacterium]|nr:hypothetical protein [Zoogloeaceae bacterium]
MAETATGRAAAPAPSTTASQTFFPCTPAGEPLFAVREGLPAHEALEQAVGFISTAKGAATFAASEAKAGLSETLWSCINTLELAEAVLEATSSGMRREAGQAAAQAEEPTPITPAPEAKNPDLDKILEAVETMDMFSQDGFDRVKALARMALRLLELPETYSHPDTLAEALNTIVLTADDNRNFINCEAEAVGANYVDELGHKALRARMDAVRAASALREAAMAEKTAAGMASRAEGQPGHMARS